MSYTTGRPKKFKTVKALENKIKAYFKKCDNSTKEVVTKDGRIVKVKDQIPYTIEGLCLILEMTRQSLLNYMNKGEDEENGKKFFDTIKNTKNKIQLNKIEGGLRGKWNSAVTIFDLKNNHGYIDKIENDVKTTQIIITSNAKDGK